MPPPEARALLLLVALAVVGQGVRHLLTRPGQAPGEVQLLATLAPGSPTAQRDSAMRQARPLRPGEKIDLDRAPLSELTRLPKVGPRLAKTILTDRAEHGPFGGLSGLDRVPGIGPGLLHVLEQHATFSGAVAAPQASRTPMDATSPPPRIPASRLNLNAATLQQLDSLPGVGPAKAAAILRYRSDHGPFSTVDQLEHVPGFGPGAVARVRDRLAIQ